jgi:hypothetical protein
MVSVSAAAIEFADLHLRVGRCRVPAAGPAQSSAVQETVVQLDGSVESRI